MKSTFPIEGEKPFLFTLRWISSAIVMFGHTYSIVFRPYKGADPFRSLGGALEHIAEFRHSAVIIFFVLSGYLVGGGILKNTAKFNLDRYFVNRFSRIYIVLIPALMLTAGLDLTAYLVAPDNEVYTTTGLTGTLGIGRSIFEKYDFRSVFVSLFSLETIGGDPMGSNRALWSLGLEWVFYFLFPASVFLLSRGGGVTRRSAAAAAVAAAVILFLAGQRYVAVYWIIWTLGAFCSQIELTGRFTRYLPWIGGVVGLIGVFASSVVRHQISDPLVGIGFALLLTNPDVLNWRLHRSFDKAVADFSYSLYVIHMPILVFMIFLFYQFGVLGMQGLFLSWVGLGCFLLASSVQIGVAFMFGRLFERRTDDLRRALTTKLSARKAIHESV